MTEIENLKKYKELLDLGIITQEEFNQKKAELPMWISDKADFRARKSFRDKEEHYIMIKGSILKTQQSFVCIYMPKNRQSKYMRQKLTELQGEIDKFIIRVGDFNIPPSESRSRRQKNQWQNNWTYSTIN